MYRYMYMYLQYIIYITHNNMYVYKTCPLFYLLTASTIIKIRKGKYETRIL